MPLFRRCAGNAAPKPAAGGKASGRGLFRPTGDKKTPPQKLAGAFFSDRRRLLANASATIDRAFFAWG